MKIFTFKLLFFSQLCCLFGGVQSVGAVDYLFEHTAPVAQHNRKKSPVVFPLSGTATARADELESQMEKMVFGVFFIPPVTQEQSKVDKEALTYHAIDACRKDEVELDEVYHDTPGSEAVDLVIYDPRYRSEINSARKYSGVSVPWDPLYDISSESQSIDAHMQDLARVLSPDCLPARFRFVYIGSKRYQEIRYGKKAWEKTE
jgi:hypothetical protein